MSVSLPAPCTLDMKVTCLSIYARCTRSELHCRRSTWGSCKSVEQASYVEGAEACFSCLSASWEASSERMQGRSQLFPLRSGKDAVAFFPFYLCTFCDAEAVEGLLMSSTRVMSTEVLPNVSKLQRSCSSVCASRVCTGLDVVSFHAHSTPVHDIMAPCCDFREVAPS